MTPDRFNAIREGLDLTWPQVSALLGLCLRQVNYFARGTKPIPPAAEDSMERAASMSKREFARLLARRIIQKQMGDK